MAATDKSSQIKQARIHVQSLLSRSSKFLSQTHACLSVDSRDDRAHQLHNASPVTWDTRCSISLFLRVPVRKRKRGHPQLEWLVCGRQHSERPSQGSGGKGQRAELALEPGQRVEMPDHSSLKMSRSPIPPAPSALHGLRTVADMQ